jgi:hypothetical protein
MNRGISVLSAAATALMLSNGAWAADEHPVDAARIAAASTAADHEAIAQGYDAEATTAGARAAMHEAMARAYRAGGPPKRTPGTLARHCDRLGRHYEAMADEFRQLAAAHRRMAMDCCKAN